MADRPVLSTYRLQLNRDFTLRDAAALVPYLHRLGVSHIYSSPVLAASPGSTHGYDVIDPTRLNPELGGRGEGKNDDGQGREGGVEVDWRTLVDTLHRHGMGLVLDIVPNHMAAGHHNPYWDDVLRHGRASRYARWFDIDWTPPQRWLHDRVLVPVLGDELDAVIARGELSIVSERGEQRLRYFEHSFPLKDARDDRNGGRGARGEGPAPAERALLAEPLRIPQRASRSAAVPPPAAHSALRALLASQHYVLAHWRRAAREINYRRFFDINELVALRMEDPEVFAETHQRVLEWVADGSLDGLRIDHVDGLLDPRSYLERLRTAVEARSAPFFIVVEKILSPGERLRREWPVEGTTGYEFLNDLEALFVHPMGGAALETLYRRLVRIRDPELDFLEVAIRGKLLILRRSLVADVRRLTRLLLPIARRDPRTARLTRAQLTAGIVQLIACLPVYRTYIDDRATRPPPSIHPADREVLEIAVARARARAAAPAPAIDLLAEVLLLEPGSLEAGDEERHQRLRFIAGFQQTSGPAAAKGVEDTALYRYAPLLSLNEVGGEPDRPLGDAAARLHEANAERVREWPHTLLSTYTHDTKRSADLRARLDVLSEIPAIWIEHVARWRRRHRRFKRLVRRRLAPDTNTEYLFYQTLAGVWPLGSRERRTEELPDAAALHDLRDRVEAYMLKAVREAKKYTSWVDPDPEWEGALSGFVHALMPDDVASLSSSRRSPFLAELGQLAGRIARPGLWNALSRVLIHLTVPGTPDLYQGSELWNFRLVDPDNRRPVDFALRDQLLDNIVHRSSVEWHESDWYLRELIDTVEDGCLKLHVIRCVLHARRTDQALFVSGSYEPVAAEGTSARHVFAFLRRVDDRAALVLAPRLPVTLTGGTAPPVGAVWGDTIVRLPASLAGLCWRCVLSGTSVEPESLDGAPAVRVAQLLNGLPVALALSSEL